MILMYPVFLYRCRPRGSCVSVFCRDTERVRAYLDRGARVSCKRVMLLGNEKPFLVKGLTK